MSETLKRFSNRRGEAAVISDGMYYIVEIVTYSNLRTGAPRMVRQYTNLDSVIAGEYFDACKNELKNQPIIVPKTWCSKCKKSCNEYNCPPKIGGADYYKIFQASCVYRKAR